MFTTELVVAVKRQLLAWSWRSLAAEVLLRPTWLPPITGQSPFVALAATVIGTSTMLKPASTSALLAS